MVDKKRIENAVLEILTAIGEDANRQGLQETPMRVANMYQEIFSGIHDDPHKHLKIFNESEQDGEIVAVRDIPFHSMCEHHLLPFKGRVQVAYIPKEGKIIGISKFSRIVECFAKRPQVQERLTSQIADFIYDNLNPYGVAVIVDAEHLCMTMRGTRALGSQTRTASFKGNIKADKDVRAQVMEMLLGSECR